MVNVWLAAQSVAEMGEVVTASFEFAPESAGLSIAAGVAFVTDVAAQATAGFLLIADGFDRIENRPGVLDTIVSGVNSWIHQNRNPNRL